MTEHRSPLMDTTIVDSFYLGAYWGPRRESAGDCATRTVQLLRHLQALHPRLAHWRTVARKKSERRLVDLTVDAVEPLFKHHYNDFCQPVPELGFDLWLSNSLPSASCRCVVSIGCGAWGDYVGNTCIVKFPGDQRALDELLDPPVAVRMIMHVVESMEPEWAILMSSKLRDEILDPFRTGRYVGIVTYLASHKFRIPECLDSPTKRIDISDHGSIFLLTEERFAIDNPDHIDAAKRLVKVMRKQGVFKKMKRK